MHSRLLVAAVIAAVVLLIAVPIEYIVYNAGLLSGAQAAAAWGIGIGIGIALAFLIVYWRTRR